MSDHDFFYYQGDWEVTYHDDMEAEAFADAEPGVYRMGRLKALPDRYAAVIWEDGGQQVEWFETREEALAFVRDAQ